MDTILGTRIPSRGFAFQEGSCIMWFVVEADVPDERGQDDSYPGL